MDKLYVEYLEEKYQARRMLFIEDKGFIEYEMYSDNTCHIWSFYVKPEFRHEGLGTKLEEMLIEKEKPSSIACQVELFSNNPELSLRKILTQPYKIVSANSQAIILRRDL